MRRSKATTHSTLLGMKRRRRRSSCSCSLSPFFFKENKRHKTPPKRDIQRPAAITREEEKPFLIKSFRQQQQVLHG
jgi:hypothetical protein